MKKCIITIAVGEPFERLLKYTAPFMEHYSKKVDADFLVIDKPKISKKYGVSSYWECLQTYELTKNYDLFLTLDVDILIKPNSPSIFDNVDTSKVCAVKEPTDKSPVINNFNKMFIKFKRPNPYFVTGVLVSPSKYRECWNPDKYENIVKQIDNPKYDYFQGLLNYMSNIYDLPIEYIDEKWNGLENSKYKVGANKMEANFMHMCCLVKYREAFTRIYAKMLSDKYDIPVKGLEMV